jgi:hypothetical protein
LLGRRALDRDVAIEPDKSRYRAGSGPLVAAEVQEIRFEPDLSYPLPCVEPDGEWDALATKPGEAVEVAPIVCM